MVGMRLDKLVCVAMTWALVACSDDASSSGEQGSETQATSDESAELGDGDGDPLTEDFGPVRGGLEITDIEISQSVVQPLYAEGAVVDPASYIVPVVPRRYTIFRALWDTPEGWTERPLIARLHVRTAAGEEQVFEDYQTLEGEPTLVSSQSVDSELFTSFFWRLEPELVSPGLSYRVSVWEAEPAADIEVGGGAMQWPSEGYTELAVEAEPAGLRLAIVGIRYEVPGCSSDTSALPEDELEAIRAGFEVWNGVETDSVTIDTGISVDIDSPVDSVVSLLSVVGQIRAELAEEIPDAFFFIMLDDCSVVSQGVLGVAPVNSDPPVMEDAATRFGAGLWNPNDITESVNTIVHEVGHAQGAPHAPCGIFDAPDPDYPHADASIGVRGLDPLNGQMYSPSIHTDFMSYCRPFWVSDYRFTKSYNHQRIITSWGAGNGPASPELGRVPQGYSGAVLSGVVAPSGEARWWVNDNPRPAPARFDAELRLELRLDGQTRAMASSVKELPDLPGAKLVQVPLVEGVELDAIRAIHVIAAPGEGLLELELDAPEIFDAREIEFHGQLTRLAGE